MCGVIRDAGMRIRNRKDESRIHDSIVSNSLMLVYHTLMS